MSVSRPSHLAPSARRTRPTRIWRTSYGGALLACAIAIVASSPIRDARAQGTTTYVVQKGDTCPSVAQKVYGDSKRIDLIHQANPLGPPPHNLKEGQVLVILPASGAPTGPDATVGSVRNRVDAFTPAQHPAKVNEPLSRGSRVSTEEASAATIDFRDETRMFLGENTLVVILGDTRRQASSRSTAPEASLANGSLRTRLGELSGKSPGIKIQTDSGTVAASAGETQVSIDPARTTRLAVYKGQSSITAQKKQVDVSQGFGSKAEKGKVPTPPRPLPAAPEWASRPGRVVFVRADHSVSAVYANGTGSGKPASRWHVQLARDSAFKDIVLDTRVAADVTKLDARNLEDITYYAHVSAIDDDQFEGPWGETLSFTIVYANFTRGATRHQASVVLQSLGAACTLDGAPTNVSGQSTELHTRQPHVIRCSPTSEPSSGVDMPIASTARGEMTVAFDAPRRASEWEIFVRYQVLADGQPVEAAAVHAVPPTEPGFLLISDAPEGSFRVARIKVPSAAKFTLPIVVDDDQRIASDTLISAPNDAIPASRVVPFRVVEINALGGIDASLRYRDPAPLVGLDASAFFRLGQVVAMSAGARATTTVERPRDGDTSKHFGYTLGVPVTLRVSGRGSTVEPFLAVQPALVSLRTSKRSDDASAPDATTRAFAASWSGGISLHLGPGQVMGEVGYRRLISPATRSNGSVLGVVGLGVSW